MVLARCRIVLVGGLLATGADLATGNDKPRSLPLLATPTPHVNCVLYPEHSLPISKHGEQYGLRLSHLTLRLWHAKQSSAAPLAGALLLLFLGASMSVLLAGGHGSGMAGMVIMAK